MRSVRCAHNSFENKTGPYKQGEVTNAGILAKVKQYGGTARPSRREADTDTQQSSSSDSLGKKKSFSQMLRKVEIFFSQTIKNFRGMRRCEGIAEP